MRVTWLGVVLGSACAALTACATTSGVPAPPPPGSMQELRVDTDPSDAACSILREGNVVATVAATPGVASVSRNVCPNTGLGCATSLVTLEIVCRKEGHFDARRTIAPVYADTIGQPVTPELTSEQKAIGTASAIAYLVAMGAPPLAAPVALPLALGAFAGQASLPRQYIYAYPAPPVLLLAPTTCESEAACDALFATMRDKLTAEANARKATIDAGCHYFPCRASDAAPCPHPECRKRRAAVDAELESGLAELSALRPRVKITGGGPAPGER